MSNSSKRSWAPRSTGRRREPRCAAREGMRASSRFEGGRVPPCSREELSAHLPAQLIVDVGAHDVIEGILGLEAESRRAHWVEALRPAGDDAGDGGVRLAANALHHLFAGDIAERSDMLADGDANAGHR